MAAPRQDRRTRASNTWGHRNVEYPLADNAAPDVIETGTFSLQKPLPDFGTAHPSTAQYPNAFLMERVSMPGDNTDSDWTLTYWTLPGTWIYFTSLSEDSEVVTVKKRRNLIANITPGESNSGSTLTKTTYEGINALAATEIVETRPLPGLVLTDYDQEPETQALITTTFQIVANPVSAPTQTPGVLVTVKHIDAYNSWLITETRSTPSGWTYQENAAFHFPSLFNYTQYSWTDACGAFSTERAGFSCNVQMLIEVSFSNTVDEFTGLQLIPNTIELGKGINVSGVLVDAGSLVYSGTCTGTITFPASSPSYSGYLALIGTSQLVGGSSKKTKYGDFRTEQLFVTML